MFLIAEALIEAGVLVGLPRDVSSTLAIQTVLGAGRLLAESGDSPEVLRAAVTSPGGTTAAGLRALEDAGVRAAFLAAVDAATARSVSWAPERSLGVRVATSVPLATPATAATLPVTE